MGTGDRLLPAMHSARQFRPSRRRSGLPSLRLI
jgi:hypothetical protein